MKTQSTFWAPLALGLCASASAQMTTFCPPNANSTGSPATLAGTFGSGVGSDLHLEVTGGPPNEFGYFLVGDQVTPASSISLGLLCLGNAPGSSVYRYSVPGSPWNSIGQFDSAGVMQNMVSTSATGSGFDVPDTIPDGVPSLILLGDTWHFQAWYRDTAVQTSDSNFTNGLSVTFSPPGTPIAGMVPIPAGTFEMGSDAPSGAPYFGSSNTQPVHTVTISYSFWIGQHEVTQAEYQSLMGTNPAHYVGANRPVESVSWDDARAYCAALTAQEQALGNVPAGLEYRLPTEAEWEYACRAGTTTEFYFGDELYCGDARFGYSSHSNTSCGLTAADATAEVGGYAPNAFGLYDMHGNIREWCLDSYSSYGLGPVADPFVTGGANRVIRGGGWGDPSFICRSAHRVALDPAFANSYHGFRVVLAPVLVP